MKDPSDKQSPRAVDAWTRRKFLQSTAFIAGGAALSSLLPGCNPAGETPAATTGPTEAPTTAPSATPVPPTPTVMVSQEPVVFVQAIDPITLDPQFVEDNATANVFRNIFEPLIDLNRDYQLRPRLCESYTLLDDQVTWRFKLRDDVTFWNGKPFTAEAVKFTVDRSLDPGLREQGLNDPFQARTGVQECVIQDDYTVDMILEKPNILFPIRCHFLYMLEPDYYSSHSLEETAIAPMGTGPYRFVEWVKGDHLTVEANPDYWRGEAPVKTVIYKPVPERAQRLNLVLAGEADVAIDLSPDEMAIVKESPNIRLSTAPGARRVHFAFPTDLPHYRDRRARQALRYAIDWNALNTGLMDNLIAEQPATVLCPGKDWVPPDLEPYEYDPEKARALLAEVDFPMDEKLIIYTFQGRYMRDKEVSQAIAGMWRDIGLNADIEVLEFSVFTEKIRSETGADQVYLLALGSRFYGPEDVAIVTEGQAWDSTHWIRNTENGPKYQELYGELQGTFDEAKQKEIVFEMVRLFEEESPWLPMWTQPAINAASNKTDWEDHGMGGLLFMWPIDSEPVHYTA